MLGGCVGMGGMVHRLTGGLKEATANVMDVDKSQVLETFDVDSGTYFVNWKAFLADGRQVACKAPADKLSETECKKVSV